MLASSFMILVRYCKKYCRMLSPWSYIPLNEYIVSCLIPKYQIVIFYHFSCFCTLNICPNSQYSCFYSPNQTDKMLHKNVGFEKFFTNSQGFLWWTCNWKLPVSRLFLHRFTKPIYQIVHNWLLFATKSRKVEKLNTRMH